MRKVIALGMTAAAFALAHPALPCGGGFGVGLKLSIEQKIVIRHDQGTETYFFSPHFCGNAAHFGLILPVPAPLTASPTLGDGATVAQLADVTKPTVVDRTFCSQPYNSGAGGSTGMGGGAGRVDGGVTVIDKGKVGLFDWTLIKADTTNAFTDWLDANQYPYDPSAPSAFSAYVTDGWYFIAFKVTADTQDPPSGQQLCGDLGPIQLSFPAAAPVIPARIAAAGGDANTGFLWRVFTVGPHQLQFAQANVTQTPRFSGVLSAADLAAHPAVAKLSSAGDRLTEIDGYFYPGQLVTDLTLLPTGVDTDYRRIEYNDKYVTCDAGHDATTPKADAATPTPDATTPPIATIDASSPTPAPPAAIPAEGESSGCSTGPRPSRVWLVGLLAALVAFAHRRRHG